MIRKISMAILITLCAILQGVVFNIFSIASIKPNLLIIITVSFGLMRGRMSGLLTGFFCGLMMDVLFPGNIGFQSLIYMWIGYLSGYCYRIFYDDDIKTPLMLTAAAELAYGLYNWAFTFLLRGKINVPFYLTRIIIPEMLYTIILLIFLYNLLYKLNKLISKADKRTIDSLV